MTEGSEMSEEAKIDLSDTSQERYPEPPYGIQPLVRNGVPLRAPFTRVPFVSGDDLAAAADRVRRASRPHSSVEIALSATGTGTVLVDGTDVSKVVSGVRIKAQVGDLTEVALSVSTPRGVKFSGEARIMIEPELRAILLAAGWEPPVRECHPLGVTPEQTLQAAVADLTGALQKLEPLDAAFERERLGVWPTPGRSDREDEDPGYDPTDDDQDLS